MCMCLYSAAHEQVHFIWTHSTLHVRSLCLASSYGRFIRLRLYILSNCEMRTLFTHTNRNEMKRTKKKINCKRDKSLVCRHAAAILIQKLGLRCSLHARLSALWAMHFEQTHTHTHGRIFTHTHISFVFVRFSYDDLVHFDCQYIQCAQWTENVDCRRFHLQPNTFSVAWWRNDSLPIIIITTKCIIFRLRLFVTRMHACSGGGSTRNVCFLLNLSAIGVTGGAVARDCFNCLERACRWLDSCRASTPRRASIYTPDWRFYCFFFVCVCRSPLHFTSIRPIIFQYVRRMKHEGRRRHRWRW